MTKLGSREEAPPIKIFNGGDLINYTLLKEENWLLPFFGLLVVVGY